MIYLYEKKHNQNQSEHRCEMVDFTTKQHEKLNK